MIVHLVDGTYELYRQHYGQAVRSSTPAPNAATIGVLNSTFQLLNEGAAFIGVATDHVIESFRNDLYDGYKTSEGMEPEILTQIPIVEEALRSMGVTVWAMEEYEADDALGSAAAVAARDSRVEQVQIFSPDKDLGQCVTGQRVVQIDRRKMSKDGTGLIDEAAVVEKFGVPPSSIADWLGLVGDTADGFPGLPGWGAKSASSVLARYGSIDDIPDDPAKWDVPGLRGAAKLATALADNRELAQLFRRIATVVTDVPVGQVDDWHWNGPRDDFAVFCADLGVPRLAEKVAGLANSRGR
ncbi:MAG: 5'-3' exonuclease H3TH domain-containing protein [Actinomycetota bacterium]